jgi:Glycyl-tRNA synthetase, beta subunit
LFALRNKPKGSSDPFALRRNAQGLTDILVDGLPQYPVNIVALSDHLLSQFEEIVTKLNWKDINKVKPEEVRQALHEFLLQRLRFKLESKQQYKREVIDAVLEKDNVLANMADADVRCRSLERLISSDGGFELIRAGVRVGNILKPDSPEKVDSSHFTETIERQLWDSFNSDVRSKWEKSPGAFRHPANEEEYDELLALLRPLSPLINKFFDDVMVNDEDKTKRDARHGVLKNIDKYFSALGSFKKLQPILPSPVTAGT